MNKEIIINQNTNYLEQIEDKIIFNELSQNKEIKNISVKKIIENSCLFYGCNFKGRIDGTKNLINESYKIPIILKDHPLLVLFPLNSLRSSKNIWINFNNIKKYYQISKCKVLVEFIDGYQHLFYISYYIFHTQILKCSRLIVVYNNRNR